MATSPTGPARFGHRCRIGSTIVFASGVSNLTPNDSNNASDVFSGEPRCRPALPAHSDEPALAQCGAASPNPANASCPSGFFSAGGRRWPGSGLTAGAFGMEVLLDEPGTRVLAGGLNFGGLIDAGQVGFAGFTIANPANEGQRLNLSLTGSPASSSSASLPVRVRIARRTASSSETVFEANPDDLAGSAAYVPPASTCRRRSTRPHSRAGQRHRRRGAGRPVLLLAHHQFHQSPRRWLPGRRGGGRLPRRPSLRRGQDRLRSLSAPPRRTAAASAC